MRLDLRLARAIVAGLIMLAARQPAAAQNVAAFYRGNKIHLTVGATPGADEEIYARLVAKYLGKHVPGDPKVVAADMPGTRGHVAAGYIYSAAPKDGTAIGAVPADVITAPLWLGFGRIPHDPTALIYLGSAASESTDCFVSSDTPVHSLRDAFARSVTMGADADGGPTRDGPLLLNAVLGTRFRVVAKYAGTGAILAAIEQSEVEGACGLTWSSISTRHPDWLAKGVLRGLVQESVAGAPLATRLGIPLAVSFAGSAGDAEVLALAYAQQAFSRPFILPPGTPPARVAALRQALLDTLRDPDLSAEARAASLQVDPLSGQEVTALVAKLFATPPELVSRLRAAFGGSRGQ